MVRWDMQHFRIIGFLVGHWDNNLLLLPAYVAAPLAQVLEVCVLVLKDKS